MEHATSSESAPTSAAAAPAANPLVECLLRGGKPKEICGILAQIPGIANSVDAQGSYKTEHQAFAFSQFNLKKISNRDFKSVFCLHILGHPVILYAFKRVSYLPAGGTARNRKAMQLLLKEGGADPNVLIQGKPLLVVLCENAATRVR
jgi:hypothetical protein